MVRFKSDGPEPWTLAALREQLAIPGAIAVYGGISWLIASSYGVASILSLGIYGPDLGALLVLFCGAIFTAYLLRVMLFVRPRALVRFIADDLRHRQMLLQRLALGLPVLIVMPVFFALFSSMKTLIPVIHPYDWDLRLEALDRWLLFGRAPWQWLQFLMDSAAATTLINFVYNSWLFVMLATVFAQAFAVRRRTLRMQFLLGFILCWALLGNLLATVLSSAGPCFYGRITGATDVYAPLMERLTEFAKTVPVWSLNVQQMLWNAYQAADQGPVAGGGISAMPSLHVATSMLMFFLARRISARWAAAAGVFLLSILLGSIHLGWHYAVDGYVSLLLTPPIWWLSGRLAQRIIGRSDPGQSISE